MKKTIITITMLILMTGLVQAVDVAFDGFESASYTGGTGWTTNWTNTGSVTIFGFSNPYEGNRHVLIRGNNAEAYRETSISGYSNIKISIAARINSFEGGDQATLSYTNGGNPVILRTWTAADSDNTWRIYEYELSNLNPAQPLRVTLTGAMSDLGDELHVDNVRVTGDVGVAQEVNVYVEANYAAGVTTPIYMTTTETNTLHTLILRSGANTYCNTNTLSPSVANTLFETTCTLPNQQVVDVEAHLYVTNNPSVNNTKYFNVLELSGDPSKLSIDQVYYSPQVLQGGNTEVFAVIKKTVDVNLTKLYVMITYPDGAQRRLSMEPTINENEYKAFITDTYRTGYTNFTIKAESTTYNAEYTNQYYVVPFTVDYVANVGTVTKIEEPVISTSATMQVFGTEYVPNEPATVFLQLVNEQGLYINDGLCYINIYYPNLPNQTKPVLIQDGPMLHLNDSKGLYYYDLITPNYTGVYMATASCSYSQSGRFVYDISGTETDYPNKTVTYGTFSGNEIFLNDYEDWIYTQCAGQNLAGTRICDSYYDFDTTLYFPDLTNITSADLYFMGEASSSGTLTQLYYWNWNTSTWILLPNTISYTTWSSSPLGVGFYAGNTLPLTGLINNDGVIRIRVLSTAGSTMTAWYNWLNIKINTAQGTVKELKGGSEIHISELYDRVTQQINEVLPNVWNYTNRTLTYYPPTTDETNYTRIDETILAVNESINNNIDFTRINLTGLINDVINSINNVISLINNIPINVWNYTTRTLTYYEVTSINYSLISNLTAVEVWNYTQRELTYYPPVNVDYDLIGLRVWNTTDRNLTYYPEQVDLTNYTTINEGVWNYVNRNLTYYPTQADLTNYTLINQGVWEYNNRTLTFYPEQQINYSLTAETVWNYTERELTYYEVNNITPEEVWSYLNRTLTYYEVNNISSNEVWTYFNRTLTYYPDAFVNSTEVADETWNYAARYTHGEIIS